ncbi:MAG: hypothetical protein KDA52_10615 [Planctomycetaceae bacterium]|nr:hypothetical protein [Planctomycetaceae bacterium]
MRTQLARSACYLATILLLHAAFGMSRCSAQVYAGGLDNYRHTYHPEHGYVPVAGAYGLGYGGYGYGGATTAEGSAGQALAGAGQLAQGVGQMNLSNAQAQQAHQEAYSQYLQNQNLAQETTMEMSKRKNDAQQQHNEQMKTAERAQVALYNKTLEQMSAAHRLTAEQLHIDSGVLHWPFVLRGSEYTELRNKLDHLYAERTPDDSGKDSSGYDAIQDACRQMQEIVNQQVKLGMPANDFVTAKHFISSVAYEAEFPVKASN